MFNLPLTKNNPSISPRKATRATADAATSEPFGIVQLQLVQNRTSAILYLRRLLVAAIHWEAILLTYLWPQDVKKMERVWPPILNQDPILCVYVFLRVTMTSAFWPLSPHLPFLFFSFLFFVCFLAEEKCVTDCNPGRAKSNAEMNVHGNEGRKVPTESKGCETATECDRRFRREENATNKTLTFPTNPAYKIKKI